MASLLLNRIRKAHPAELLVLSYIIAIGIGTTLLLLPWATVSGRIPLMDALFTATSAICVTGLIVVDTGAYFTQWGQTILLVMIQLGGLGIMTASVVFFQLIGKRISYKQRMAVQGIFSHTPRADIYHLLKSIFLFTGVLELAGTGVLFLFWRDAYPSASEAFYAALFHSVSAFCNAGFSLFANSFADYQGAWLLNITVCALIVLGGIGFPVVYEFYARASQKPETRTRMSVQTKTVLTTSLILIVSGMVIFLCCEGVPLERSQWGKSVLQALFQSITCRTAGFNTVEVNSLMDTTLAFFLFLMLFGASPGSCGGGIKTTTLAILGMASWSRFRGRADVTLFRRNIPRETVQRSISIFLLAVAVISVALFLLLLFQQGHAQAAPDHRQFLTSLFEVVSAFGTVGLSMGATGELHGPGKLLIIVLMLVGRVGILTFAYLFLGSDATGGIERAQENVMIG